MSELRWNPLLEEWVAVAAHRQVRPISLGGKTDTQGCPFCPGGAEGLNAPYEIVAFDNKFPSFAPDETVKPSNLSNGLYRTGRGKGVCEVVLYSDKHDSTLAGESVEHIYNLIRVWTDRYRELAAKPFIKYVYIFENKGGVVGVTLKHPHGQIYAFPFIPPKIATELAAERKYMRRHRRCLVCDIVKDEMKGRARLVAANRSFAAYIPFFARYPYEVHISSRRHLGHLGQMTDREHRDLAGVLKAVMMKYDRLYGFSFPYIMLMKQTPTDGKPHRSHHFHIEFYPPHRTKDKIKYLAGCESGAGTFITDTIPEAKAAELRRM